MLGPLRGALQAGLTGLGIGYMSFLAVDQHVWNTSEALSERLLVAQSSVAPPSAHVPFRRVDTADLSFQERVQHESASAWNRSVLGLYRAARAAMADAWNKEVEEYQKAAEQAPHNYEYQEDDLNGMHRGDSDEMPYVDIANEDDNFWVECKETDTGRVVYYNNASLVVATDIAAMEFEGADGTVRSVMDQQQYMSPVLAAHDGYTFRDRGEEFNAPDKLLSCVQGWSMEIESLLLHTVMSEDMRERLDGLKSTIDAISTAVEEEEQNTNKNDVQVLTEPVYAKWSFENPYTEAFRASAARFNHKDVQCKDYYFPQYYAHGPLPAANLAPITADVFLAEELRQYYDSHFMRLIVGPSDTANSLIERCFTRMSSSNINMDEFVLKGYGLQEYMDGDEELYYYDTVRAALRRRETVQLQLTHYPIEPPVSEDVINQEQQYIRAANMNLPAVVKESFQIPQTALPWKEREFMQMCETPWPFRTTVLGCDHINEDTVPRMAGRKFVSVKIKSFIFHGTQISSQFCHETSENRTSEHPRWNQDLEDRENPLLISTLPREARICFILCGMEEVEKKDELVEDYLAYVSIPLVDHFGRLVRGKQTLNFWSVGADLKGPLLQSHRFIFRGPIRSYCPSAAAGQSIPCSVTVEFIKFALPVVAPFIEIDSTVQETSHPVNDGGKLNKKVKARLDTLLKADPLYILTDEDKEALWMTRNSLTQYPLVLSKFLQSVQWFNPEQRKEAHRLLKLWDPPHSPVSAIELLDVKFADYSVREYAVTCLQVLQDDELSLFMLQLVQTLKFESYHDSPLARFLISRALSSPYTIGHMLYWNLKADSVYVEHCERFALLMEEYLSFAGAHTRDLRKQQDLVHKLTRIAGTVVALKRAKEKNDAEILSTFHEKLHLLNDLFFSKCGGVQISLNPKWVARSLVVEKCKYMSSKMAPLWLVFKNKDPDAPNIIAIFKSGDDLRQDILTLQLLQVMDKLWLSENLDMRLTPYTCVATGHNIQGRGVGMIQVVLESDTTSKIQLVYGGGAMGALKMEPLERYIADHNKKPEEYELAIENFIRSCAGYCVSTFVLGIGDRHNGNIMVTQDGHLFHIDFGHFLGNFKSKFGIKRERAAFVLTPEMAYVMGGKKYKKAKNFQRFETLCEESFSTLRKHASLFINLFILMVSAGMPELMYEEHIHYLRDKFYLQDDPKEAINKLRKEIRRSLGSTYRSIDNFIHNLKHK